MKKIRFLFSPVFLLFFLAHCKQPGTREMHKDKVVAAKKRTAPAKLQYHSALKKEWSADSLSPRESDILLAVNRTDLTNLEQMDSILVPADMSGDIEYYLPFPFSAPYLKDIDKIIFFSYPAQAFGAYEQGELVYTGPTNMGRKTDPTPAGLYFTNWKAKETTSTFNDEWELKWNFNIQNKKGIGWHQYAMPGYPASHSCLRLIEKDAKYLYDWADEWIVQKGAGEGADKILAQGTPVIVFGEYPFGEKKPWGQLVNDSKALNISAPGIQQVTAAYLDKILEEQEKRKTVSSKK